MLIKVYASIWIFMAAVASLLYLSGNFTRFTFVVFGFISFGLTFMGMMFVLPATVAHPEMSDPATREIKPTNTATVPEPEKVAWYPTNGIKRHAPRYP